MMEKIARRWRRWKGGWQDGGKGRVSYFESQKSVYSM